MQLWGECVWVQSPAWHTQNKTNEETSNFLLTPEPRGHQGGAVFHRGE